MFITLIDLVAMGSVIIFLLLWLILYFMGMKYHSLFDSLEEKDYPLKELYGMGYALMEAIHYSYKSKWDRDIRNNLTIIHSEKYAEYYLRVIYAQIVSINFIVLIFGICLMLISGEPIMLLVIAMFIVVIAYYFLTLPEKQIEKRSNQLLMDYAEVVSNLALLTNAGMILREAWEEVAFSNDGVFYQEMQRVVEDLNNGIGETDAFRDFGIRCVIPEAKKFASIITQGIQKGNSELAKSLQAQSTEVWEQKKQLVKRQGEKSANSLMVPIYMMFIGILIMIIVPIFTNLM